MSDLWTEEEIEKRILGTLPMPVHHAMNLSWSRSDECK